MEITWTEPDVKCELVVRWWNAMENSTGSREPTLADLKRANEEAGLISNNFDYFDREEAFEREEKLKVRIAVLEAEQAAYLNALAVDGLRPTTVMIGIESLKSSLAGVRETLVDADARGDAAIARAEKSDYDLTTARERIAELEAQLQAAQDTSIADRAMDKFYAEGIDARGVLDGIDLAIDRAKKAEALYRGACEETLRLNMDLGNARGRVASLERELSNALQRIEELDVELNRCARDAKTLAADSHKLRRRIEELEAPIEGEPSPEALDALWENARGGDHTRMLTIWRHARLAVIGNLALANKRITDLEAELDLAKRNFALANEAYDELQARFDELASSPERIALLEALEPHDQNAARAAAAMKLEHEAARAVLGAREGEDLLSAARRAVGSADLYRTHYRRAVISNFTADRAMTEGLAECDRLRARIAELEASVAERESLRDLMVKSAEARLSCGLYIPREGLIEVGVGRGGQTYADTPQNAVWELERLLRERVGGGGKV